jgi:redox-sensitive bicupin YhaK (pirin superfamily)
MMGLILFLGLIVASACATVTRGVEEVFVVETNPVGAKVTLLYDEPAMKTKFSWMWPFVANRHWPPSVSDVPVVSAAL